MAKQSLQIRQAPAVAAVHRPPAGDVALMALAAFAVSTSGPLIAAAAAPALAIAFWRNAFATGVLLPVALVRRRRELAALTRPQWLLALAAGALLAAHFATWIPSVSMSSVASATALVSAQPVWTGLLARALGHRIPSRAWLGIWISLAGVVMLTGVDFTVSSRALAGDLLAVAGGALAAGYVTVGALVRRYASTTTYTLICYGTAALLLLGVCVLGRQPLGGYDRRTWLLLAAMTLGPQLLGHSLFNRVLRTTSPTVVSLAILFEVPGAALIAWLWLGQSMPPLAIPAALALLTGLVLVVTAGEREAPTAVPVE
jgi:drug/metabolite transporter (DMT)-like permease